MNKEQETNLNDKSYNPFTMWGSYLGALVGGMIKCGIVGLFSKSCWMQDYVIEPHSLFTQIVWIETPIIFIICGFIFGYGIHSILRMARK